MTPLSRTTTRNSTLTKTSTRGSSATRDSSRTSTKDKKPGILSKLRSAFGKRSSNYGNTSDSLNSALSEDTADGDEVDSQLTSPNSRRRRRSSAFTLSKSSREANDSERLLEERKSRCMAIKVAKRDPLPIQRLLVDCEFCNPPQKTGRDIDIGTPRFTADTVSSVAPPPELANNELAWNPGLAEWNRIRNWWLTPTAYAVPEHHMEQDLTPDKFYTVYDKMVYQTRPLKHPLNLDDMLQIVKAGWVGEGTWPAQDDPNDVWSTSDAEEIKEKVALKNNPPVEQGTPLNSRFTSPGPGLANSYMPTGNGGTYTPNSSAQVSLEGLSVPSVKLTSPGTSSEVPPGVGHVQFSELPHPKEMDLQSTLSRSREGLPPLERLQSGMGSSLKPVRSTQSSLVSLTDSD